MSEFFDSAETEHLCGNYGRKTKQGSGRMAQTKMLKGLIGGLAVSFLMALLSSAAMAHGEGERTRLMVGEYLLTPVFAQRPKAGENFIYMQIVDGMGKPVTGAQVEISAKPVENADPHQENMTSAAHMTGNMDNMGDMQGMHNMHGMSPAPASAPVHDMSAMGGKVAAPTQASFNELPRMTGDYFGIITLSAAGHWLLNTHFRINDQMFNVDFPVEVAGSSSPLTIIAAFFVLNAFIIGIASFTKRKTVSV